MSKTNRWLVHQQETKSLEGGINQMEKIRLYLTKEGKKNTALGWSYVDIVGFGFDSEGSLKEVVVLADGKYLQTYFGIDLWEDLLAWYEARPTQEDTNKTE